MSARLIDVRTPKQPQGAVIVIHGGAQRAARAAVSPTQLSVVRMVPIARRIARAGHGRLAVVRLLNTWRGWDTQHTPLQDAAWAIDQVSSRYGVPIALVGHSLGGRGALLAATDERVRAVVALNAWLYPDDGEPLPGRRVLFVHGDADHIAPAARSRRVADRLARSADVRYEVVEGGKHAMLRHGRTFERLAADFVVDALTGDGGPDGPVGGGA
ncbi:alpha/beta hydrolase [Nocardioides marinquilinus]|uniref:Alpha/beta hydrolase n=1 Tax=Nocardioides marinquilinus TaxID=1210400 RepID=A0ABP9PHQ7_9ACTN